MDYIKIFLGGLVGGLIVLAGSALMHLGGSASAPASVSSNTGAAANVTTIGNGNTATGNLWNFTSGLTIGTTTPRSTISGIQFSTCQLIMLGTITASTTREFDCAVSGVTANDVALTSGFASTTAVLNTFGGIHITEVHASSTSGFLTFKVSNFSGADYAVAGKGYGSSTPYFLIR